MRTTEEWTRLLYGLLGEGVQHVARLCANRPIDPPALLWLAMVERARREYREDRTKGKPS